MMPVTLLYHDVVEAGCYDSSGFPGAGAARYKLTVEEFRQHLAAIAAASARSSPPVFTIDDGGSSSVQIAADLEAYGWRGQFFVTTDRIGSPGFLDAAQIRALRAGGHVIGTHSCSHPARMSACSDDRLVWEWRVSCERLAEILKEAVTAGSVPGGYYSRRVAETAAAAGMQVLYTSEPTTTDWAVYGCRVAGRYAVYRGTSARVVAALVSGCLIGRAAQSAAWQTKKLLKRLAGPAYPWLRTGVLERFYPKSQLPTR
jgi:peptidoglycan/xylan/chitin deacetylase (PgdA/CDA1 family)